MTRIKKNRAPGQTGARKSSQESIQESKARKRKAKRKGLPPGSRHNVENTQQQQGKGPAKDPRLGSKKPIPLTVEPKKTTSATANKVSEIAKVTPVDDIAKELLTPEQELEQLESNERLNALLDEVDAGKQLGKEDARWLDSTLARHQQLLEQLGLLDDDEEEEPLEGDDLWTRFMDAEVDPAQYEDKEDKS